VHPLFVSHIITIIPALVGNVPVCGVFRAQAISGSQSDRFLQFLTNLDQPMPLAEKVRKLTGNLWRRVVLRQTCCGNPGEPGC
jgi:hypothetical protein